MSRLTWLFVLVFLIATERRVSAQNTFPAPSSTGANALETCTDASGSAQISCLSYLVGFVQGLSLQAGFSEKKLVCLPDGVTGEQSRRVVVKWLQDHPENLHRPA